MKGRQLSLEEVLNLEDGSLVWVDDELFSKEGYLLYNTIDFYRLETCKFEDTCFYEWIKGLDLTDENIYMIIKEFS